MCNVISYASVKSFVKHFARNFINFSVALAWYRETNEVAGTCNVKTLNANVIIFYSEVTF